MMYPPEFKKFLLRVAIFASPIVLMLGTLEFLAQYSGELMPLSTVVKRQFQTQIPVLFGREVVDQELSRYKYLVLSALSPDVVALGSSRVMQMRQEMFPQVTFYNAGGMIHGLGELSEFTEIYRPAIKPRIIFFGIDHYWFGHKRDIVSTPILGEQGNDPVKQWPAHLYTFRYLAKQLLKNPSSVSHIFSGRESFGDALAIGLQALYGNGFRTDGSYQYATYLQETREKMLYRDRESPPIVQRVRNGVRQFPYDSKFVADRLSIIDEFLEFSHRNGIEVAGFLPPMSSEVYNAIMTSPHHRGLLLETARQLPAVFKKYGYVFSDYSKLDKLSLTDLNMFDGLHPTETAISRIILDLLKQGVGQTILPTKSIVKHLSSHLNNGKSRPTEIAW
ncbi:MAG: hypothetical protein AAB726_00280 [Patescibacteria group bacterium]